jgi:hypothetical protein
LGHSALGPCASGHCVFRHSTFRHTAVSYSRLAVLADGPLLAMVEVLAVGGRVKVVAGAHALAVPDRS